MSERRTTRGGRRNPLAMSAIGALLVAVGAGCVIAVPLSNAARLLCVALAVLPVLRPVAFWGVLIAAIPLLDFSTKTGWLFINEYDAFFFVATGLTYIRIASDSAQRRLLPTTVSLFMWTLVALYALAAARTLASLPAWGGNAISNYQSPWHALYQLKGLLYPLLTLPIMRRTLGQSARRLSMSVALGTTVALAYMIAVALWERYAFTAITNFAADYRISLGISSMHVGSGTLESYLALAAPMLIVLLADRSIAARILGFALLPLTAYIVFVTFSRGLYAGIVAGTIVGALCLFRAGRADKKADGSPVPGANHRVSVFVPISLFLLSAALLVWQFPTSGYRGVFASLTLLFALFVVLADSRPSTQQQQSLTVISIALGLVLIAIVVTFSPVITKGPYLAHAALGIAAICAVVLTTVGSPRFTAMLRMIALACAIGLIGSMVSIARYWGGERAAPAAYAVGVLAFAVIALSHTRVGRWSLDTRSIANVGIGLMTAAGLAVVLGAGFFKERVEQSDSDLNYRARHWLTSASTMLREPSALLFGNGLGRYHALYLANKRGDTAPTFWWRSEGGGGSVHLQTGHFARGWGEVLRMTQRVAVRPGQDYEVILSARPAERATVVEVLLCEKVLMIHPGCGSARFEIPPLEKAGARIEMKLPIKMPIVPPRVWRPASLSFALEGSDQSVDVLSVRLQDSRGENLLRNSDFAKGMDNWFYTSDHFHLPWHAHNMMLTAWIDAGALAAFAWVGLIVSTMAYGWGSLRAVRSRRAQSFEIAALAGLSAVMMIGVFDSLIDIPRVTTWMLIVVLLSSAIARLNRRERSTTGESMRRSSRKSLHRVDA